MPALICGSLAFDTITNFHGRFAQQILPEQVHILNVSFLVPTLRREYGGCAGNIAYTHKALGGEPIIVATLGSDGQAYRQRLIDLGLDLSCVRTIDHNYTAQAIIITDESNNQITAFHPGAMGEAHHTPIPTDRADIRLGIVAPDGRDAMMVHARQMHEAGIPFIFDPGQGLPMFSGPELQAFVQQATWVAVNDYEARMLSDRTGHTIEALSRSHLKGVIVTLGAEGCEVWVQGERTAIAGHTAQAIVDPTGCGDAFRAALLYGLERDWPLQRCVELGNRIGALKIAHRGGQNHPVDPAALGLN